MLKKIWVFCLLILLSFLYWCTNTNESQQWSWEKIPFVIEILNSSNLNKSQTTNKIWVIKSKNEISLSSQAQGKIIVNNLVNWKIVKQWDILIELEDNVWSYQLSYEKTKIALDKAQIDYDTSKINLEKAIADSKINLDNKKINYDNSKVNLEKAIEDAKINLDNKKINYDNSKINLEKAIKDAEINLENKINNLETAKRNYETSQKNYETALKDSEEKKKKAKSDLENTKTDIVDSKAYLEIENLKNDIEKAKLDLETQKTKDNDTLNQFLLNFDVQYKNLNIYVDDVIFQVDSIVWLSEQNKSLNDNFENYLWAKNSTLKTMTESELKDLMNIRTQLKNKNLNSFDEIKINELTIYYLNLYSKTLKLLDTTEQLLQNTTTSQNFTQAELNWLLSKIDWLQSSLQVWLNSLTTFKNSLTSFLNTYKDQQKSIEKSISILENQLKISQKNYEIDFWDNEIVYTRTILDIENNLKNIENAMNQSDINYKNATISVKDAENLLQNSKENKELTLRSLENNILDAQNLLNNAIQNKDSNLKSLENNIQDAQNLLNNQINTKWLTLKNLQNAIDSAKVSLKETQKEVNKLKILSPIDWTISKKYVDNLQEVSIWTKLADIVDEWNQIIEIWINENELIYFKIWDIVDIESWWKQTKWTINSITNIADDNLKYNIEIIPQEKFVTLWNLANVYLTKNIENLVIPLNYITIIWEWDWYINIYSWWNIEKLSLKLWNSFNWGIEILNLLTWNFDIITTDLSNYNPSKNEIKLK